MKRSPIIGITPGPDVEHAVYGTVHRYRLSSDYTHAVEAAGGIPVILPLHANSIPSVLDLIDGLLFSGGADIDPNLYGDDSLHPDTYGVDQERDEFELSPIRSAIEADKPVLCICRGIQILNVAYGGTLVQHIPDDVSGAGVHRQYTDGIPATEPSHEVLVTPGSLLERVYDARVLRVNSLHHQSVKEIGEGILIAGKSPDGVIEAISVPDASFVLGVQWHPEMMHQSDPLQMKPFEALVAAVLESSLALA